MISKIVFIIVSFFTFFQIAIAVPTPNGGGGGGGTTINQSQCNVGSVSCCNQVQSANHATVQQLTGLLGIVLGGATGQVGINCTPVTVIGAGGNSCSAQPVCCTNNDFNGLINVGCSPVNLNL
ncbi:fungal hydrophobin [Pluteus cervinus]|uniref:Fungal hydrophobin n=1 Tax=Pluteus cervinus TaxID=181527 RepID=A0ACD3A4E7_9AGAR|nr:fungal hydrophobin [Pluteus cervinus]